MANTKFVVVGIILLIAGGFAYSYTSSLLPQVQQGRALCQSLLGQAGQLVSPQVSTQCQQAQDFGPMITAAVPISAVLAVLGFMLGILGSFIDQKKEVAQVPT